MGSVKRGDKRYGKRYEITNKRFAELHNKATSIEELLELLRSETGENIGKPFIYWRRAACQRDGFELKSLSPKKPAINVAALNHILNTPPPQQSIGTA